MLITVTNIFKPETSKKEHYSGAFIDYLLVNYPNGFTGVNNEVILNGSKLAVEDYDTVITEEDTLVLVLNSPAAALPAWVIQIIVTVVIAAVQYLITPKPIRQKSSGAARRVYQIGSGQNVPALGNAIAEHFGKCWFFPDVASQPYTFFQEGDQYLHQLLLIGAGEYEINSIKFGNTDINTLQAGLVETRLFPQDHKSEFGTIYSEFGIFEDVVSSADVQGLSLAKNSNGSWFGQFPDNGNKNYIEGTAQPTQFEIGDTVKIFGVYPVGDMQVVETTITDIVGSKVAYVPIPWAPELQWQQLVKNDDGWRGWFVSSPIGKKTNRVEVDIEYPQGLYRVRTSDGALVTASDYIALEIQGIDDDGNNVGAVIYNKLYITGASRDPKRVSFPFTVPLGRYKVRMRRTDTDDFASDQMSVANWVGLKSYCPNTTGQYAYGNVTILAIKIKASSALPSVSDQISVQATRILPTVESNFLVKAPTVNPVDSFAKIVRDTNPEGVDVPSLQALGIRWDNTNGFNYRFDEIITVYEALQTLAYSHRATPQSYATKLTMRVDDAKPYDQFVISQEHMTRDSYVCNIRIGNDSERVDGYRVAYQDFSAPRAAYVVYPAGALAPEDLLLSGCTDSATALAHGQYSWTKRNTTFKNIIFGTEYDALAFNVGDRISVLQNVVNNVRTVRLISHSGRQLTVDGTLFNPNIQVVLRDQYGVPSAPIPASMDDNVITLSIDPPFALFGIDSAQESTSIVIGDLISFSKSYVVSAIEPDLDGVKVEAVNYSELPYLYPMPGEVIPT